MTIRLRVREERWPLAAPFVIARGAKTEARVVLVEVTRDGVTGRGEAVPYARYGETAEAVIRTVEHLGILLAGGLDRHALQHAAPAGAARNAIDCALWDLEAKASGSPAWRQAGLAAMAPVVTAFTLSLGTPEEMQAAARLAAARPVLKLKIGGADDLDRVEAVRQAAPVSRLVVDANEALSFDELRRLAPEFERLQVSLIEQPLASTEDAVLEEWNSPVPLCADESLHTRDDLSRCARRYTFGNVKLDKTGGLTEALALVRDLRASGMGLMVGCMVATSLAMAPALILAQGAEVVDLDGPLLLARDREPGLRVTGSTLEPPGPELWG